MNMKKFLTILVLGLAIFAVSCSDESMFKMLVGGQSYESTTYTYEFSASGDVLTRTPKSGGTATTYSFVSAESATSATYKNSSTDETLTIGIQDGSITVS